MSRSRIAFAVAIIATLLPAASFGRGFGPLGIVRYAVGRLLPLGALHRSLTIRGHRDNLYAGRSDAPPPSLARGQTVAAAALAGWHNGRAGNGWWRHDDGGYGWVGPLFWPFAYDDIAGYTVYGDDTAFWAYGYPDIYAGIFAPYDQAHLAAYMAASPRRHHRVLSLQAFCGDAREPAVSAGIDQIRQAIAPNEAQRADLDDLAAASLKASEIIRASCPTQAPSGAPERLQAMQARIAAMKEAVLTLQPPFGKLYDALNDTQKARLNALAQPRRKMASAAPNAMPANISSSRCEAIEAAMAQASKAPPGANQADMSQAGPLQWPASEIEQRLHPTDDQRAIFDVLRDASDAAAQTLMQACEDKALTPPARLAAAAGRLDAWLDAVKPIGEALDELYATMSDEQKAQFESIGPGRTS